MAVVALANVEIVMEKLHMRGHIDKWCSENCDPHNFFVTSSKNLMMYVAKL